MILQAERSMYDFRFPQDSLAVEFAIATTLLVTLYMMLAWMHSVEKKMECEPEVLIHVSPNCWQISPRCRVWKEKLGFMHFADCGLKDFFVFFFFFVFLSSSAFFLWIPVWNFQPLVSIINHHLECPKHFHKNHHPPSHQVDHISAIQTNVNSSSDNTFHTPNVSNLHTVPGAWTKP